MERAQVRGYWARNSLSTFVALLVVSFLAFLLQPAGTPLLLAAVVGGALIHVGARYRTWWGTAIICIGLLLPVWPVYLLVPSKLLMWIQIVAPMFATVLGLNLYFRRSATNET